MSRFDRILALSPHTDDVELCCGGTIARFIGAGADVTVVAFSDCRESVPNGAPADILALEFAASMRTLNVPDARLRKYAVRRFDEHRQEILEELVRLRREIEPDLVLLPSCRDIHQDHQVIHAEALRAFKAASVLGYEAPWNHAGFDAQAFIALTASQLDRKIEALRCYASQFELARAYFAEDYLRGWARFRGVQAAQPFAEAFEVIRLRW